MFIWARGILVWFVCSINQIRKAGGNAHGYKVDITDESMVQRIAQIVASEVGQVDVLVNNGMH
jgi:NAD(P)-dependent dehydrogenase (short-subunit alcohol dehydrogenase family)